MNKKQRMDEIYENLLWMANRPGVAIMAKYEDPYTGETVIFSSLKKSGWTTSSPPAVPPSTT
jgi:hypothetical protein